VSLATIELDELSLRDETERLPEPSLLELLFGRIVVDKEKPAEGWVKG
jgi:hypothetical protein